MEEWKEYKLGEVCDLIAGYAFKAQDFGAYPQKVIRIGDINPPFVNTSGAIGVDISKYDSNKLTKYVVSYGDFVLAMTGATIGKIGRYIDKFDSMLNQRVLLFKPKTVFNPSYIYYILTSNNFQQYVINHIDSQSAQPNISANTISKYIFRMPSKKEEQKKIASILKSLDDKIENNRRINENLEQQAQVLFKSWFVDFEPFRDQPFVDSELGMIPEGWRVGTLSEIALINPNRTLKKGQNAMYLDMKNMPTSGSFPINWEKKEYSGGMKFQNKDTLMARITPCLENGKVAYVNFLNDDEIAFGSTEYIVMTAKEGYIPELLYFLCRDQAFKDYATVNMNGSSGRQRVSGDVIGNYKIAIPPKTVFDFLANYYKSVMDVIKRNGYEIKNLAQLRDTLLPKLMSGEISL